MATGTLARPFNTKYERQWNEAEAIRSIFYDEFEEAKFPWKSDHPPHFTVHLNETDLNGSPLLLDLEIGMIDGYPENCPPEIKLVKKRGLATGQIQTINDRLQKKAQDLIGTEMVFDLVDEAKNLLSSVAKKKVSFHDEMVTRRAADEQQVKAAQREKQAKLDEAEVAKRHAATQELDELMKREMETKDKLLQTAIDAEEQLMKPVLTEQLSQITFVPELAFPINGTLTTIQSVKVRPSSAVTSWLFGDVLSAISENGLDFSLLLVRFITSFYAGAQGRRKLDTLVRTINETAKGLPERTGLVRILGAQIEYSGSIPVLQVLTEPLSGTRLDHVLAQAGSLNVHKSLKYVLNLLDSLGHLHANGVIHRDVRLRSLYVSKDGSMLNLAFPLLSRALLDLDQVHPISNVTSVQEDSLRPPETLSKSSMSLGRKADIWSLGTLMLQLILGPDCLVGYDSALEAIDSYTSGLPAELVSFLRLLADHDPAKRPLVSDLIKSPIFKKDSTTLPVLSYEPIVGRFSPGKGIFDKRAVKSDVVLSRYKSDFEEIQFLGKGAFGAVIKVRNRIDNRYYAVKRIKLDKRNAEENQKILREVTTLSRLHHDRIIRYYQAWIEGQGDDRPDSPEQKNQESMNSAMAAISFRSESEIDSSSGKGASSGSGTSSGSEEEGNSNWLDGTYNEDSMVYSLSNSSLLDLAINHTGFSDQDSTSDAPFKPAGKPLKALRSSRLGSVTSFTDNETEDSTENTDAKLTGNGPFLYIQMEYCPNQTLRDFIDEGLLEAGEVWRLFRQVLEGLAYIHSQVMIHRDLKPSNIFLDSNGDIKIGDFGLAVADAKQLEDEASKPTVPTKSGISLTGAVGTPFYMSPEQEKEGASRYTNKVDMYSAGIIFVELVCGRFATTMERIEMLRAVRRASIDLPPVFMKQENSKAQQVALNLLAHDPKARLSADELLKRADLIPPKMEDESIKEAIRSLTLPGNPHYTPLVQALFAQNTESFKDFVFDLQAGVIQDANLLVKMSKITARLSETWTNHGAIELSVPLLMPATSSKKSPFEDVVGSEDTIIGFRRVTMLDSFGSLVNLPCDLTTPFARFVGHNRITELRRFSFDRVYKPNPTGGQPRQSLEGTFDIVHQHGEEHIHEAHVIKTALDSILLNVPKNTATSVLLQISSSELVCAVAKACGIETAKQSAFLELAARTHGLGWIRRRNMFSSFLSLIPTSIDSLSRFQKPIMFEKLQFLLKQEPAFLPVGESIQLLLENLSSYGLDSGKIHIDPLFCLPPEKFNGVMFYISYHPDKKISHMLAYGGRYDRLVESYAYPRITETCAVGFELNLPRLALLSGEGLGTLALLDVLVFSTGSDPMIQEKMAVVSDLWTSAIKADFLASPNPSPDMLVKVCKKLGISWFVILREHTSKGQYGTVKVRDVEKRQEVEVLRTELSETLLKMMNEKEPLDESQQESHHSHHQPVTPVHQSGLVKVHIFSGPFSSKLKPVQKSQISERALKSFSQIFSTLTPTKSVEIMAHDLPTLLVNKLVEVMGESEEVFRKAMEAFPGDREVRTKFRTHLRSLKERGDPLIPLYNYRDNIVQIIPLLK